MHDSLQEAELEPPEFEIIDEFFIVTFPSHLKPRLTTQLEDGILKQLSSRQLNAVDHIYESMAISSNDYAQRYDLDLSTARRDLRKLVTLGILKKRYVGKSSEIYIVDTD